MASCPSTPSVTGNCSSPGYVLSTPADEIANSGSGFINSISPTVDILTDLQTTFSIADHYPFSYEYAPPTAPTVPDSRDDSYDEPAKPLAQSATIPAPFVAQPPPPDRDLTYSTPSVPGTVTPDPVVYVAPPDPDVRATNIPDPSPPAVAAAPSVPDFIDPGENGDRDTSYTSPLPAVIPAVVVPSPYVPPPDVPNRDVTYATPAALQDVGITPPAPYVPPDVPSERDSSYTTPVDPLRTPVVTPTYVVPSELPTRETSFADPNVPSDVSITPPSAYTSPPVPTFDKTLEVDTTGQPGAAPVDDTGDSPAVVMPTMPTAPTYAVPEVPTLDGITVPNLTPLDSIDTSVTIPTVDFPDIGNTLDFTNAQWSSADLADMQTHMDRIRNGDFAIGTVIWGQIYDRAAMQLRRDGIAREREGRRAWAKKGWEMPGGVALAQQEQAAFDINSSSAKKALEVAVQEAVQKDDQFWKSVERGVAIEGLYAQAHDAYYERALRFSVALQEAGVAVYNALVARFAVQVQAAEIAITEKRLQIDAQRLTLESDKLSIDAALARGEADKLQLDLYQSKWEGVKAAVDVYVAEVTAVKTNVDAQRLNLEAFGLEIQHYATKVDAWGKEWSGYESKMRGEQTKATVFDSYVKAYGADISAFGAKVGGETARISGETDIARIQLENAKLSYDKYDTEWRGISAKLDSISKLIASDAAIYESRVRSEDTRVKSLVDIERVKQEGVSSDVARFKAEWDGVSTKLSSVAQLTQSDVDLYNGKVQGEVSRIRAAVDFAQIQQAIAAFDIERFKAEWDAISTKLSSAASLAQSDAAIYSAKVSGEGTRLDSSVAIEGVKQEAGRSDVQRFSAEWQAIGQRLNAIANMMSADASIYQARVQGASAAVTANVEEARLQVDAGRVDVERYRADWQGVSSRLQTIASLVQADASIYQSKVQGASEQTRASTDTQGQRVDALRADVQRFAAEWQGIGAKLDGMTRAMQADASVFKAKIDSEVGRIESSAEIAKVQQAEVATDVDRFRADWTGIAAKLDSASRMRSSDAQIYQGQVSNADAASRATLGQAQISLDFHTNNMQGSIEGAKIALQGATAEAEIAKNAQIASSNLYAQLAAAAMATHSYSYSTSNSAQCSTSYSNQASNSTSCSRQITESND